MTTGDKSKETRDWGGFLKEARAWATFIMAMVGASVIPVVRLYISNEELKLKEQFRQEYMSRSDATAEFKVLHDADVQHSVDNAKIYEKLDKIQVSVVRLMDQTHLQDRP